MYKVARELRLNDRITRAPGKSVADFFQAPGADVAEVRGLALSPVVKGNVILDMLVSVKVRISVIGEHPFERDVLVDPNDVFTLA